MVITVNFHCIRCYISMYKTGKKDIFNMVKTRGGIVFHNSLRQSIRVNNFVRTRALNSRNCAAPVRCEAANESGRPRRKNGMSNMQQTIGKCGLDFDLKEYGRLGFARPLKVESPIAAPLKFFCLPFFNSQAEHVTTVEPRTNEDADEFLFVGLNRFLARNATSVLHNVIFQQYINILANEVTCSRLAVCRSAVRTADSQLERLQNS